jgi:DNA-binding NarL/FixJ family response regulator
MTAAVLAPSVALVGGMRLPRLDGVTIVADSAAADVVVVAGVAAIEPARRAVPGAAVLVYTTCDDDKSVFDAMRAGARGYLLAGAEPDDIVRAIRGVAAGEMILCARVAGRLTELMIRQSQPRRHPFPDLTAREREILDLVADGMGNAAIARRLLLAPKTVRNNISMIFGKLGVTDRSEAIARVRDAVRTPTAAPTG